MSGQCVADATDAAACVAGHSQPLERERWPRAIPQQVLQAPKIARHITVDECDPHTRVDGKPAVLPGKHVGGRLGVEEARASEPADQAAADLLGDRCEIGLCDRAGRQERRGSVATCSVGRWHEDTVGDAGVQMHMAVEGGAEAMQEGDGPEPRAGGGGSLGCRCRVCGGAEQPLDLGKEDLRESGDGLGPVGEEAAQPLRHGDHPLSHGHRRDDVIDKMGGGLRHVPTVARRADAAALARERHDNALAAARAEGAAEAEAEDAALEKAAELLLDGARHGPLGLVTPLEPAREVLGDDLVERRLLRAATLVAAAGRRAGMRPGAGPRGKPAEGSDHGRTGEWTGKVIARTLTAGCRPPPAGPRHRDSPDATARESTTKISRPPCKTTGGA